MGNEAGARGGVGRSGCWGEQGLRMEIVREEAGPRGGERYEMGSAESRMNFTL